MPSGSTSRPARAERVRIDEIPGVFAVDKPPGVTSHDVVDAVRDALGGAKAGHAGTLDPQATGVLVICLGAATKITSFLMEGEKEYEGRGHLGIVTDTQDASGKTLAERPVECSASELRLAAERFVGSVRQIPPMFSAVKVGGQKLYRLARRGLSVERPERVVQVHSFEILDVELPWFDFRIRCSKGTYVRSIMHDLGESLGCGGHLRTLRRTRQGMFEPSQSLTWEQLTGDGADAVIRARVVSPREALEFLPERGADVVRSALKSGALVPRAAGDGASSDCADVGALVRLVQHGESIAVARAEEAGDRVLHVLPAPVGRPLRREVS